MECNHKDNEGELSLQEFHNRLFCNKCNTCFGRITKDIAELDNEIYQKGEIQIKQEFSFFLDFFKKVFEDYDVIVLPYDEYPSPLSKSDESINNNNGYIGLPENMDNKASGINQVYTINNQASKIAELESEVKRLEKIVIGLSEKLINEKKVI